MTSFKHIKSMTSLIHLYKIEHVQRHCVCGGIKLHCAQATTLNCEINQTKTKLLEQSIRKEFA